MSATTWLIIAIVGFSLSGVALVAAVFMFVKLKIPAVIGDLSGKTVAREIRAIRDANASSGNKIHRPSRVNVDRGELTEKGREESDGGSVLGMAHSSKRLDKETNGSTTESLSQNVIEVEIEETNPTEILSMNQETEILTAPHATEVLSEVAEDDSADTYNATTVLSENIGASEEQQVTEVTFKVTKSIIVTHTNEVIE